jgi:hypothetical protein
MSRHDDQLRQALRTYAAGIADTQSVPHASLIWLRAERRKRRLALERAERPVRIMQIVGLLCAACAAAWLCYRSVALHQLTAIGTTGLVFVLSSMLLVFAGCWAMLILSRRPSSL